MSTLTQIYSQLLSVMRCWHSRLAPVTPKSPGYLASKWVQPVGDKRGKDESIEYFSPVPSLPWHYTYIGLTPYSPSSLPSTGRPLGPAPTPSEPWNYYSSSFPFDTQGSNSFFLILVSGDSPSLLVPFTCSYLNKNFFN